MDRRRDDRVCVQCDCTIYVQGFDETCCIVKDISEVGIAFEMNYDEQLYESITKGMKISFSYLDTFCYIDEDRSYAIIGKCHVTRKTKNDKTMIVGCDLVVDNYIRKYVTCRKVAVFISEML